MLCIGSLRKDNARPRRGVHLQLRSKFAYHAFANIASICAHLQEVLAIVPFQRGSVVLHIRVDPVMSTKSLLVAREDYGIFTGLFDANPVVYKRLRRVEIEDEEESGTLKDYHLVDFVFEGNIRLDGF